MNIVYVFQADEAFYNVRPSLDPYDGLFQTYNSLNYEALTIIALPQSLLQYPP